MKKYIIFIILTFGFNLFMQAQATVGSNLSPNSGAILDLKQNNGEASSTKGLGLPRVWLYNKTRIGLGVTHGDSENQKHAGLLVYNLNHCMISLDNYDTDHIGLQVWDGERWQQLSKDESLGAGVTRHTDQEGNKFLAGDFGDAGVWMLQNVRAKKYAGADGKSKAGHVLPLTPSANVGTDLLPNGIQWVYPAPHRTLNPIPEGALGVIDGTDPFFYERHKEMGLLYSWWAASGGENMHGYDQQQATELDELPGPDEVEAFNGGAHIRGICPEGWHLPTDREWNKLEKELSENPDSYTNGGVASTWPGNVIWGSEASNWYGTHARNFAHQCKLGYSADGNAFPEGAKSKSFKKGGFDSLPVGYASTGSLNFYGVSASYWTASAFGASQSGYAWKREISYNQDYMRINYLSRRRQFSIRCKLD